MIRIWWRFRYGTCRRLRDILAEAPWSNYDLLSALAVLGIGVYLLLHPTMFQAVGGVYARMAQVASEWLWAGWFIGCGSFGLAVVLWCTAPGFGWRLAARMAIAFCVLILAGNNALYVPPPLSTVTYGLLAVWSVWGILRTRGSGR